MRNSHSMALVFGAALIGTPAMAQQPAPSAPAAVPEQMPFDVPYGTSINLDHAKQLAAAAEAEAKKHNWKMAIAVVDTGGDLVYLEKIDNTQLASVQIAINKAKTSARFRRETRAFFNAMESGHPYVVTLDPSLLAAPGGFPLVEGGKLIGAIGCSGGFGDQDAATCKAGADLVK